MTADDPRPAGEACRCGHRYDEHRRFPCGLGCTVTAEGGWWADACTNYRPAASGGATDGERECARCGQSPESHAYPGSPAYECVYVFPPTPVASQADGELREDPDWVLDEESGVLYGPLEGRRIRVPVASLLATPEAASLVRQLLDGVAAVQRVRELASRYLESDTYIIEIRVLLRALGGGTS